MFHIAKSMLVLLCAVAPSAAAQCASEDQSIDSTARAIREMAAGAPAEAEKLAKVKAAFDGLAKKKGWDAARTRAFQHGLAQDADFRAVELQRRKLNPQRDALYARLQALDGTTEYAEACKVSTELAAVMKEVARLNHIQFDRLLAGAAAAQ